MAAVARPAGGLREGTTSTSGPSSRARTADWNSRGLGTLTPEVTQAIERSLDKEAARREQSMQSVTDEDIAAVRCNVC